VHGHSKSEIKLSVKGTALLKGNAEMYCTYLKNIKVKNVGNITAVNCRVSYSEHVKKYVKSNLRNN